MYLVMELIHPMQVLCYVFRGNIILLSKLPDLIYISTVYNETIVLMNTYNFASF